MNTAIRKSEPNTAIPTAGGFTMIRHKIRESIRFGIPVAVIVCALAASTSLPLAAQETGTILYAPHNYLPMNGRIILSATGGKRRYIQDIGHYAPQLVADMDTIPLRVEQTFEVYWKVAQVILVPEHLPTAGKEYRLSTLPPFPDSEDARWSVRNNADTIPPEWYGRAAYIGGCDRPEESHYAYIALPIDEEETIAVEILLRSSDAPSDTTRILLFPRRDIVEQFSGAILISSEVILQLDPAPTGQLLSVPGHLILPVGDGIYGGGIQFKAGANYQISMTAIDEAGNRSKESIEGIIRIPEDSSSSATDNPIPPTPGGSGTELKNESAGIKLSAPSQTKALIPEFTLVKDD